MIDFEYAKKIWLEADTFKKLDAEYVKYEKHADPWIEKEVASDRLHHSKVREYRKWSDKNPVAFAKKRGHDLRLLLDYYNDKIFYGWVEDYKKGNTNKSFSQLMKEHQKGTCKGIKKPGDHINWARRYIDDGQFRYCEQWPDWRVGWNFERERETLEKYKGAYAKKQGKLNARKIEVQKQNQILKKQLGFTK